jgi:hypothetical protein
MNTFTAITGSALSFAVIAITTIAIASALRIVMLDIPSPSMAGESVELMCSYDLENDRLYSIKW